MRHPNPWTKKLSVGSHALREHCKHLESSSVNRIHLVCHLGTVCRGVPLGHLRNIWGKKSEPEIFPNICKCQCRGVPLGHLCRSNMLYTIPLEKKTVRSERALAHCEHLSLRSPHSQHMVCDRMSGCASWAPSKQLGKRIGPRTFSSCANSQHLCATWAPYVGVCLLGTSAGAICSTQIHGKKNRSAPVENQSKTSRKPVEIGSICGTKKRRGHSAM